MNKNSKVVRKLFGLTSLAFCASLQAYESKEALKKQLSQIFDVIETNYGPLQYKQSLGLSWDGVKLSYLNEIDSIGNMRDYYFMMGRFLSRLNDAHVSIQLPSNYAAELPAQFSYVEGKTILNYLSPLGYARCAGEVGDELITLDGRSPDEWRAEFVKYLNVGKARSNQSYLTYALTARSEARGLPLSTMNLKKSELVLLRARNQERYSCTLSWKISGAPIIGRPVTQTLRPQPAAHDSGLSENSLTMKMERLIRQVHRLFNAQMNNLAFEKSAKGVEAPEALGRKQVLGRKEFAFQLPANAKPLKIPALMTPVVQLSGSGLQAAIIPYKNMRVGVLRIPSYMGTQVALIPLELRFLIGRLQQESDMLLIDQTHNPGGAVSYSDWLVTALNGKLDSASHMKFLMRPRQNFLRMYAEMLEMLKDESLVKQKIRLKYEARMQENLALLTKAYEEGAFLSAPIDLSVFSEFVQEVLDDTLFGRISELPAYAREIPSWLSGRLLDGVDITKAQVYTHPVYMLVDELDFSGGDATPAVLQDYGRVKIVGVETAGAGGTVEAFQDPISGFGFHLTTSLMYRKDGSLVENVGVKPEFRVEPTIEDYRNDFRDYFNRIMEKITL